MGLDTTHDCWHGSYGGFMHWRACIARLAGFGELLEYEGFTESGGKPWPPWEEDPLVTLLAHSDCDGQLELDELLPLAVRLWDILNTQVPDGGFVEGTNSWHGVLQTERFLVGLLDADFAGEVVEFH